MQSMKWKGAEREILFNAGASCDGECRWNTGRFHEVVRVSTTKERKGLLPSEVSHAELSEAGLILRRELEEEHRRLYPACEGFLLVSPAPIEEVTTPNAAAA